MIYPVLVKVKVRGLQQLLDIQLRIVAVGMFVECRVKA